MNVLKDVIMISEDMTEVNDFLRDELKSKIFSQLELQKIFFDAFKIQIKDGEPVF